MIIQDRKYKYLSVCRRLFLLLLLFGFSAAFSQKIYYTSMMIDFSAGNNGVFAPIGNDCGHNDVEITYNNTDGIMNIVVDKVCHSWSFVQNWMGNKYAPSIIFRKRYVEFRIKSTESHIGKSTINFVTSGGNPDGSFGKSIPIVTYDIVQPDIWETKYFYLEGNADTVFKEIQFNFENGTYAIDYIYYGDVASAPAPNMNSVSNQTIMEGHTKSVTLTGIYIPGRRNDGLVLTAEAKTDGIIKDVSFLDFGSGIIDEQTRTAILSITPYEEMAGQNDSIIVWLRDTIRGKQKRIAFNVNVIHETYKISGNIYQGSKLADNSGVYLLYKDPKAGLIEVDSVISLNGTYSFTVINKGYYVILAKPSMFTSTVYHDTYLGDVADVNRAYKLNLTSESGSLDLHMLKHSEVRLQREMQNVILHPNPARSYVSIDFPVVFSGTVSLIDVSGRIVQNYTIVGTDNELLDLSGIVPGMYYVKISGQDGTVVKKIIIE